MAFPSSTCSQCDSDAVATLNQEPLCEKHAHERLQKLKSKQQRLQTEFEEAKQTYENLKEKYNVTSYGHIEQQLNVDNREDIDESDVQAVNEAEMELSHKREKLQGVEQSISSLKSDL